MLEGKVKNEITKSNIMERCLKARVNQGWRVRAARHERGFRDEGENMRGLKRRDARG